MILVHGLREHAEALREDVATMLAPLGLRLSAAKTQVAPMSDGFDFLGFRIVWKRKRGTDKWYVYTFIADKPIRALKRKIRSLTRRRSQVGFGAALTRINQIQRGWANYFKYAVAKHTFDGIQHFTWVRIVNWVRYRHRLTWTALKRRLKGPHGWQPIVLDEVKLFNMASATVSRYRWRGTKIPPPWPKTQITEPTA